MPIKVTHVVRQYHPSVGGMEDVVQNIAQQQLSRHGHAPTILTLDRLFRNSRERLAMQEVVDGIPVIRLPYHGSSRYPLCPSVLQHVRDTDVIHVHGIDFFYDFLAATRLIHGRPMLVSTHGGFFHTRFASKLKKIYFNTATRLSARAYEHIIATSDNDGAIFEAIVRAPKKVVIENGVNIEKFRDQAARSLRPALIYFGRWSENKGLLETINFFQRLHAMQAQWQLIIAGREYDYSVSQLQALLRDHHLSEAVQLVCNPTQAELSGLIAQSSYFICQSRHEGFGIAPIEAMSAGLTPVLSDIPPFRHLIEEAGIGILIETSIEQGVRGLLALHEQGEDAYTARREQAQGFVARYDWKHIVDKYVAIYQGLVEHSSLRPRPL